MEERSDRFTAVEDRFAGYAVYDPAGEKIGKVDDLFVDQSDEPEYLGVKMGFLGTRSTLIPWDAVSTADDEGRTITVDIDEDELRVQRSEEELAAGTREREAGQLKVRKRVRTDRETIEVPTRHEEVSVERVPVEGEASEAEIGEEEVVVPVTEEEVVVGKRAVAKEEVRIRKEGISREV